MVRVLQSDCGFATAAASLLQQHPRGDMAQAGKAKKAGSKKATPPERESITFDYLKSNYFRVVRVNGVVGGIAPNGDIHMAVWNQRSPYPRQVVHAITADGELGPEISRTTRETDIVRELEAGLVFDASMARAIIKWLETRLSELSDLSQLREEPQ
jgi:hypothetical protein